MRPLAEYRKESEVKVIGINPGEQYPLIGHHLGPGSGWNYGNKWLEYWKWNIKLQMRKHEGITCDSEHVQYFAVPVSYEGKTNELGEIHP